MPSGTGKSNLLSSIAGDLNKAHQQFKGAPTEYDTGGSLPAGIDNGVAQLVDMKFDLYKSGDNKGKPFFSASGVVVSPTHVGGQKIEGRRTYIREPLCATPNKSRKTFADHWGWIRNEISKFLGDGEIDKLKNPAEEIENVIIPALLKQKPYFQFRTWKGTKQTTGPYAGKEPLTNEVWNGKVEYNPDASDDDGVSDSTEDDGPVDSHEEDESQDTGNLSLAERAQIEEEGGEDTGARGEMSKMCIQYGIEPNDYADWYLVQEAIDEAIAGGDVSEESEEAEEEEEASEVPEKGSTVSYNRSADIAANYDADEYEDELTELAEARGVDPNDYETWGELAEQLAKGKGSTEKYEVTFVSESKRTVNLKHTDGTIVKGVSWDSLK